MVSLNILKYPPVDRPSTPRGPSNPGWEPLLVYLLGQLCQIRHHTGSDRANQQPPVFTRCQSNLQKTNCYRLWVNSPANFGMIYKKIICLQSQNLGTEKVQSVKRLLMKGNRLNKTVFTLKGEVPDKVYIYRFFSSVSSVDKYIK